MRRPRVAPWLSEAELRQWVRGADSRGAYQRRLAVWLTFRRRLPAHEVAALVGVSTGAVWRWLSRYNRHGPGGLTHKRRGGRHRAFLTLEQERELLVALRSDGKRGPALTAKEIRLRVRQAIGRDVSLDYVYRLLHRHGWRKRAPWKSLGESANAGPTVRLPGPVSAGAQEQVHQPGEVPESPVREQ
jgi:transposase